MAFTITKVLILINVVFYALCTIMHGGNLYSLSREAIVLYAFHPIRVLFFGEYYRLITSFFIHANIFHLFFNMYALYILGTIVEGYCGAMNMLILYMIAGLFGNIASILILAYSLGSSAAIFSLLSLLVIYERRAYGKLGSMAALLLLALIVSNMLAPGQVNNLAHIAGVAVGVVYGYLIKFRHLSRF